MTMRTKSSSAFTLIELLIVVTIIAVLASIALPAFNGVKERGDQTKDLSNAKQIALALRQFAIDNNGAYPSHPPAASYAAAVGNPANSNEALWWLFASGDQTGYLQSEQIFAVAGSAFTPSNPDNKLDAPGAGARADTLKAGENAYAYVSGLTDTSNPTFPIVADGFVPGSPGVYAANKSLPGGVWAAKKAIIVFCDASGQIVRTNPANKTVERTDSGGAKVNMFVAAADWFDNAANPVLNPQ
jgi:prepilin-type N-terminal cleavage/methylation domain-containing protein